MVLLLVVAAGMVGAFVIIDVQTVDTIRIVAATITRGAISTTRARGPIGVRLPISVTLAALLARVGGTIRARIISTIPSVTYK